ncbi:MAG: hypothetical protein DA408_13815 [Bacteroidetes bacterium]|nr:MAG: hypothetical protein DA408_13815 [Bacteroidota bacterium]
MVLVLWQCQRNTYSNTNFPADQLAFGSGGGFAGTLTTYHLLPNGQLFRSDGIQGDTVSIPPAKKRITKELYTHFDDLELTDIDFDFPGNRYYFISRSTADGSQKITWGDPEQPVPEAVQNLYNELKALVPLQ